MKIPQLKFNHSPLLNELLDTKTVSFRKPFSLEEWPKIYKGLVKITGLQSTDIQLPIYLVNKTGVTQSDPLILGKGDQTIDIFTHEFIHRLLNYSDKQVNFSKLLKPYKKYNLNTQLHISVHAIHKLLYLNILKSPTRLKKDIAWSQIGHPDYKKAWEIVEQMGAEKIVSDLKNSYR